MGGMAVFWSESMWLPPGITWASASSLPGAAQFSDLRYPLLGAALLTALRVAVERALLRPLGRCLGLRPARPRQAARRPGQKSTLGR